MEDPNNNNNQGNNPIGDNNNNNVNNNQVQESGNGYQQPVQQNNNGGQQYNNYAQNLNQANANQKKKSKAPIIIVVVIIVVLLLGCLVSGVIFGIKYIMDVAQNKIENVVDFNEIKNEINTNTISNKVKNNVTNKTTNSIFNNVAKNNVINNNVTNTTTNNVITGDAKTSTKQAPLSKGEWGIASKYSTETKGYDPVNVKVTKFTRGEEAKKAVQDYINSSSIYKYEEPKAGLEWLVIDYDVDFANYTMSSVGTNADVSGDVEGIESSSIKYNGITYITSTKYIGSRDYVKTNTASGKIATQVPVGCTDYIVTFGAYGETKAYFKGE